MRRLLVLLVLTFPLLAHEPDRFTLDSKVLREERTVIVHLPASYGAGSQRYPVLYMTDAASQAAHTAATIKALGDVARIPEMIVVGVTNTDRNRDLTPTRLRTKEHDFPTSGGAAKFISFFESELIPEIDKRYRTVSYKIFAGHSFGGMFALETLYTRPRLFNAVIAVSPTVWWDDKYPLRRAQEFVKANPQLKSTLILAVGNEGPVMNRPFDELKTFFAQNKPQGFDVHSYYFDEDDHISVPIAATYAALRRIFAPWFFRVEATDNVKQLWPRMLAHVADLKKRYGFTVQISEERANRIGYALMGAKHYQDAIEVFRSNVDTFPASANAYDSLGEAYEAAGDREKARANYAKAVELAKAANDPRLDIFEQHLRRVR